MDGKRSDHEIKSNLCDYSDEDDERLDIDDDSSVPGSSRHKIEGKFKRNFFPPLASSIFILSGSFCGIFFDESEVKERTGSERKGEVILTLKGVKLQSEQRESKFSY